MGPVLAAIKADAVMRTKLSEVRFHTTLRGTSTVMLAYNAEIGDEWKLKAAELQKVLNTDHKVSVIGRSRKVKLVLGEDSVQETLQINGRELHYTQLEGEFSHSKTALFMRLSVT